MGSLSSVYSQRGASPIGSLIPSGSGSAPSGYLPCDGSAVSRTTYAALFSVIGTTYGVGDGSTTFNLPNTAGLFLRGRGSQTISAKNFDGGTVGNKQKDKTSQNGLSVSTSSTPSLSLANTDLTHTHTFADATTSFVTKKGNNGIDVGGPLFTYNPSIPSEGETTGGALGLHSHTITPSITGVTTTLTSSATETRPAFVAVAYYIKY